MSRNAWLKTNSFICLLKVDTIDHHQVPIVKLFLIIELQAAIWIIQIGSCNDQFGFTFKVNPDFQYIILSYEVFAAQKAMTYTDLLPAVVNILYWINHQLKNQGLVRLQLLQ